MTRGRNKPRTRIMNERVSQAPVERGRRPVRLAHHCKHGVAAWRFCFSCAMADRDAPPALRYWPKRRRSW